VVLFGFLIIMQASCFSCSTFFQWNILQDAWCWWWYQYTIVFFHAFSLLSIF
jgi:hypothetical protein